MAMFNSNVSHPQRVSSGKPLHFGRQEADLLGTWSERGKCDFDRQGFDGVLVCSSKSWIWALRKQIASKVLANLDLWIQEIVYWILHYFNICFTLCFVIYFEIICFWFGICQPKAWKIAFQGNYQPISFAMTPTGPTMAMWQNVGTWAGSVGSW